MKKQISIIGLGIVLAVPGGAAAQSGAGTGGTLMDEVVVTASRAAETVDETLAAVSVITRRDIERGQFRSLPEVLERLPGVQISRSGGTGQATSIYLRGTSTSQTLVLVDGTRIGSATTGAASLQHIPLSQIERIEVVRGPRSTLYGADAMGGVIHIFTRKGTAEREGSISAGGGSRGSREIRGSLSGPLGNSHYSVALAHIGTRGFDVQQNNVPSGWGSTPNEPDRDGYRERSASLRLGHRFSAGNEVEINAMHASGTTEYDGNWQNETYFRQQTLGITAKLRPLEIWDTVLTVGQSRDDGKNMKDGFFSSNFDTKTTQLGWQNNLLVGDFQMLTAGIDYHKDQVSSSTNYDRSSRHTTGYFLQHRLDYEAHSFLIGLRHEDNQQFGSHNIYNLGYGLRLPRNLRLTLNYGTAFRAPTFNELYWPGDGNPNLQPEKSKSYEAALQQQYQGGYWRLGVFRTDIDNMIPVWPPANVDRARIDGLELESGHQLSQVWHLGLAATLLKPKDRENDRMLQRRAERTATINLDGDFGPLRTGLTAHGVSGRYDNTANTTWMPGYVLFHLRAEYDLRDNLLLQGKIENLLNKDYEEAATYNTPGRGFFATLSHRF